MSQQLVKKGTNGKHENVMPRSWIEAIKDKNTGQTLVEILQGFNMYFLPYNGNTSSTRCLVPTMLRKKGLWITYVKYDGNVYTEWYAANEIDDASWGNSSNWRIGNNTLVGDITISANGNWVINGTETEFKAVGEKGNTPLIRVANNRLQVSYDLGDTYIDVNNNPVYTKFRWLATSGDTQANNLGRIQASTDEGKTWTNMSNDFTNNLHISRYIGVSESLPTSGIAEGTIYAKGPYYAEGDTLNENPIYRLWIYAWKGNALAWQDNGEFTSIAAGVVQETGNSETEVMSQKAVSERLSELGSEVLNNYTPIWVQGEFNYHDNPISLNNVDIRIRTVVKVDNLLSIRVNNPEYSINTGFIYGKNKDLTTYKIVKDFSNIQDSIKEITSFEPCYLMFSIKKLSDDAISPEDANDANVVFEYERSFDYKPIINMGLVLNKQPYFEQGEFNYHDNPISLNRIKSRIKTIFNIANIKSISITNTDYEISAGFITDANMNLTKNKCYVLDTISEDRMSVNVKSALLKISTFNPSLLVLSFRKKNDITADILPSEGSKLGLKFDVFPIQKEIDNLDRKIDTVVATIENRYETGFEQGEFNFHYDPVVMLNDPLRIRRVFDITDLAKITVGNPNAEMRYYILMQENESLSQSDILYGEIQSNEVDLKSLKRSATFNATKILISFGYKDNITPILPTDAKDLVIESESLKYQHIESKEIVCWGDSLTAGDGVGEYPKELTQLLGDNYIVYNQGVGGETSHTILARLGSECMVSDEDFILSGQEGVATLIADGTLNKYLKNATTGSKVTPLLQASTLRINPCYVNGIECTLYREFSGSSTNAATNKWYIKPNISTGYNLTIKANTPIICQASKNYRNKAVNIVWVGTNDGTSILSDIDSFIKRLKESDNFARPKCTIYINPHTLVSAELDNAMRKEFGNRFFNWREFISTVGLYKYGITPTTQNTLTQTQIANGVLSDIECMESGKLPSSLWRRAYRDANDQLNDTGIVEDSKDSTHMNVKGYKILAQEIYNLLIELGIVD